jgi:hypothetical protein
MIFFCTARTGESFALRPLMANVYELRIIVISCRISNLTLPYTNIINKPIRHGELVYL